MKVDMSFVGGKAFTKSISKAGKNLSGVLPYTLTGCAFDGRIKLQKDMGKYIHSPTPATIRGVYYTKAIKGDKRPFSEVKFSPLAWKWMRYQVLGGTRTGNTLTAPVAANKNSHGNVVAGQRASKILGTGGAFRATIRGIDGLWQRGSDSLKLMHVYKSSLRYESILPMQKIVYNEATRVFPAKFKQNVKKALSRSVGI